MHHLYLHVFIRFVIVDVFYIYYISLQRHSDGSSSVTPAASPVSHSAISQLEGLQVQPTGTACRYSLQVQPAACRYSLQVAVIQVAVIQVAVISSYKQL